MDGETLARAIKADPALQETVLVILTSGDNLNRATRLQEAGIFACLVKPVRQSKLRDVLAVAWGARNQMSATQLLARSEAPTRKIQPTMTRKNLARVLVADDNTTNQRVAQLMLENLGCRVDVAADGKEAIEMLALLPYDVVFMDCEMPEMDGYEATAEIRRRHHAGRPVPIIAMTAKAIQGDRERCLQAGMDDYISKPVRLEDLEEALERWIPKGRRIAQDEPEQLPRSTRAEPESSALDPEVTARLRSLAAADPAVLEEIHESFLTSSVEYLEALRQAAQAGDPEALAQAAHAFKGASGNVGASHIWELCRQLELLGNSRSVAGADELTRHLERESARVKMEIEMQTAKELTV
jgi:CheY-like chemotaxis protein/HPt (histidine-containing phosphotransfer) domain-containing protein